MAYITNIDFEGEEELRLDPTQIVARAKFARNEAGQVFLNLRTYGSDARKTDKKLCQKFQLGPDTLAQLKRILEGGLTVSGDKSGDESQFEVGSLVAEHLKKIQEIAGGRECIYRGQSNADWPLLSGAERRISGGYKNTDTLALRDYHSDLLKEAKKKGFGIRDGRPLSDLELLAELQHFGAATRLLDFTTSPLVALYFALGEGDEDAKTDGKIFICPIDVELFDHTKDTQLVDDIILSRKPTLWWPIMHGAAERRIICQSGVFAINAREIKDTNTRKETEISKLEFDPHPILIVDKKRLRRELEKSLGISAQSLFIDLAGFAQNNRYQQEQIDKHVNFYRSEALSREGNFAKPEISVSENLQDEGDEVTRGESDLAENFYKQGIAKFNNGDFDGAIADFNEAIRLKPDFFEAFINRAIARCNNDDFEKAIGDYDEAIRLMPDELRTYIFSLRGDAKLQINDLVGAIADYDEAIHRGLRMAEVFANRGDAKLQMGDLVGTIADCDEALRIKPGDFKSTRIRRRAMALNGDIDGLTADYGDASRSDSDEANFLYSLGLAKFINGDRNGAKSDIERSIELDPDQVDPYLTLGSIFIFRGNIIEARKAYEQALLLAKKQGMSEEMIANIEVSLDKIDRGVFGEDEDPPNTPS